MRVAVARTLEQLLDAELGGRERLVVGDLGDARGARRRVRDAGRPPLEEAAGDREHGRRSEPDGECDRREHPAPPRR
jgi:hypothetical protein